MAQPDVLQERTHSGNPLIQIGAASDPGRSGKPNQDYYEVVETVYQIGVLAPTALPVVVGIVADGISSSAVGDVAGQFTVETLRRVLIENEDVQIKPRLEAGIRRANHELYELSQKHPEYRNAGAAVVVAAIADDQLFIAHVGDSRVYLVRNRQTYLLTIDHRRGQEMVDSGELTPQAAAQHPEQNVLSRFVGAKSTIEVDHRIIDIEQANFAVGKFQQWPVLERMWLQAGDCVILCSDGLSDLVPAQQIEAIAGRHPPQVAAKKLIEAANNLGGSDNITVVVLRVANTGQQTLVETSSSRQATPEGGAHFAPSAPLARSQSRRPATQAPKSAQATFSLEDFLRAFLVGSLVLLVGIGLWFALERFLMPQLESSTRMATPSSAGARPPVEDVVGNAIDAEASNATAPARTIEAQPTQRSKQDILRVGGKLASAAPEDGVTISGMVLFEWQPQEPLQPNTAYELQIWPTGQMREQNARSLDGISEETARALNFDSLDLPDGEYQWGVQVVQVSPYRVIKYLGPNYRLIYIKR